MKKLKCSIVMLITPFQLVCNDVNSMDRVKALLLLECNDIATCLTCYCNVYMGHKSRNFVVTKLCLYMADCN